MTLDEFRRHPAYDYYNIQWKECSCLKGIRLEDVTVELEKEAYDEMRHNI